YERIERDAMSLGELRASAIPFHILRIVLHSLNSAGLQVPSIPADRFVDDPSVFPDVDIFSIEFQPAKDLVDKFYRAGISLTIKDITSDIGIPTFNASSDEWVTHDYGYLAEGHGMHPDARIAIIMELSEMPKQRATSI